MRQFLAGAALVFTACSAWADTPTYKNVIVILSDDHAQNVMGAYGHPVVQTPHLDQLAETGMRFDRAYCNSPMCAPSRASLLTSKYPHETGFNLLFTPFAYKGKMTIAQHLQESGFATAIIGKNHWNNWIWGSLWETPPDHGFDLIVDNSHYRRFAESVGAGENLPQNGAYYKRQHPEYGRLNVWNPDNLPQPYSEAHSNAAYFVDRAIQFLQEHSDERRFLWLALNEPHAPFAFPYEFRNRYTAEDVVLPEGSTEDIRWIPNIFANMTESQKKNVIAAYWTCVEHLDRQIGRFLQAVEDMELGEDTLIVYTSDHGYLLYDHMRFEKHTMWEEAVKVPLIFNGPGIPAGETDAMVELIDLAPTLMDYLDQPQMPNISGLSLVDVIAGRTDKHREYVYVEFMEDNKAMVADERYKYVFTTGKRAQGQGYENDQPAPGIYHRLYDLQADPRETTNLAYAESHHDYRSYYMDKLLQHLLKNHPDADQIPDGLTSLGKMVWLLEPRDVGAEYGGEPLRVWQEQR